VANLAWAHRVKPKWPYPATGRILKVSFNNAGGFIEDQTKPALDHVVREVVVDLPEAKK